MSSTQKSPAAVAAGKLAHVERDAAGKSVLALRNNQRIHAEKNADGKSAVASRAGKASMAELDQHGRSVNAQRAAAAAIAPEVEERRAATRRRNLLSRTHEQMMEHVQGMSERGAAAQLGLYDETHRQLARGEINRQGEML